MTFSKKKIIVCLVSVLALAVLGTVFFVVVPKIKTESVLKVAFYEIDERTKDSIQVEFEKLAKSNLIEEKKLQFVELDKNLSLKENLGNEKNVSVVFSYNGQSQKSISDEAVIFDNAKVSLMPQNIQRLNEKCLPILINNIELCMINPVFSELNDGVNYLDLVLEKLKTADTKSKYSMPITIPAKDDKVLSLVVSALLESRYGIEELNKVRDYIIQNEGKKLFVADLLNNEEFTSFAAVVNELVSAKKEGLMHPQWHTMSFDDVENFMATKSTAAVFMTTDLHRLLEYQVISKYTDSFFPITRTDKRQADYCFVMPVVVATFFEKANKELSAKGKQIVENLTSVEVQKNLSDASGLAPVSSFAEAADKQATNVRFWAAATTKIAFSIDSAFTDPKERQRFFAELRSFL